MDITEVLLETKSGNINIRTIGGFTSLMIAATNNEDDIVKFLCDYPANPPLDLEVKVCERSHDFNCLVHASKLVSIKVQK